MSLFTVYVFVWFGALFCSQAFLYKNFIRLDIYIVLCSVPDCVNSKLGQQKFFVRFRLQKRMRFL